MKQVCPLYRVQFNAAMSDALELANRRADALTDKSPWNSIALDRQTDRQT